MSAPTTAYNLREVAAQFDIRGDFVYAEPYGSGHINDTFCAVYDQGACRVRYIIQRVNHNIFKNTAGLMENVARICRHSLAKLQKEGARDASRRTLTLIPTVEGGDWYVDSDKNFWRCYIFVERARGYDVVETTEQAYQAAQAFGNFTKLLVDIPGGRLVDTIPNFHNTRWRFENFQKALAADAKGRAKDVAAEVDFLLKREKDCSIVVDAMAKGDIPERVTHNDTKLNNVLIDDYTQTGICVIDLDTSMPGSALYDFGDMVRTATAPTKEDETDLSKVICRPEYFETLVRGYMASLGGTLNKTEKELLPFGGKLMTLEVGMRFLTDYLEGDVYFKTKHTTHNLERCRNQFALVASIESQLDKMNKLVASL
jgi:aminoglycoside phosphotransferase (APT) family kinase protein